MRLTEMRARAVEFQRELEHTKSQLNVDFPWYSYNSLSNIDHIDQLLTGELRSILDLIGKGSRVLDIGPADGDWSFFLESFGAKVFAVDHALTNANEMRGIRALKAHLHSSVEISDTDVDNNFRLPDGQFEVAFFLGILYHLKNPFYALEKLTRQVKYLFVSTRVARVSPSGLPLDADALAYLLGTHELNQDRSNYWIFSELALRRLVERAGWQVLAFKTYGSQQSDTNSLDRDERAFLLLRSAYRMNNLNLLEGWYDADGQSWRWTAGQFSAGIPAESRQAKKIALELYIPPLLIQKFGSVTLSATIGDHPFEPLTFNVEGEYEYVRALPAALANQPLCFRLSDAIAPSEADDRELGLIVASIQLLF